jgi:hypothetical protein
MALSGVFDASSTRTIICQSALRKLGALAEGQTATSASIDIAVESFNFMQRAWAAEGMPVWYLKTGYIYPIANDSNLTIGPTSTSDHFSEELIITHLTDNAASGATSITVDASTNARTVIGVTANSDNIGVELNNGNITWTTISAGGGAAGITLAAGLGGAANSSNRVYAYTTKAARPVEIEYAWRVEAATADKIPINQVSLSEILSQTNPTEEGPTIMFNYQATLTDGAFRIWPRFDNGDNYIEVLFQNPFDDLDAASTNNPAFPDEWIEALIYGLAVRLAPDYKLPLQERMLLKQEAEAMKERAMMAARENASIIFIPETSWGNK